MLKYYTYVLKKQEVFGEMSVKQYTPHLPSVHMHIKLILLSGLITCYLTVISYTLLEFRHQVEFITSLRILERHYWGLF